MEFKPKHELYDVKYNNSIEYFYQASPYSFQLQSLQPNQCGKYTCVGCASRAAMSGEAGGDDSTSTSSPAHSKSATNSSIN